MVTCSGYQVVASYGEYHETMSPVEGRNAVELFPSSWSAFRFATRVFELTASGGLPGLTNAEIPGPAAGVLADDPGAGG